MINTKFGTQILKYLIYLCVAFTVLVLILLLGFLIQGGISKLNPEFLTSIIPAVISTLLLLLVAMLVAIPLGIFSAVQLQMYAKQSFIIKIVRFSIDCLSGIPSIIYGLFGLSFFIYFLGINKSILAGALTVAILVLPLIIKSTEEAIKTVPRENIEASLALGASKFMTIKKIVLPGSINGILTGVILAMGRIFGETAAILFVAGSVSKMPSSIFSPGVTLANKLYLILQEPTYSKYGIDEAYAIALVLIIVVILLNLIVKILNKRFNKVHA